MLSLVPRFALWPKDRLGQDVSLLGTYTKARISDLGMNYQLHHDPNVFYTPNQPVERIDPNFQFESTNFNTGVPYPSLYAVGDKLVSSRSVASISQLATDGKTFTTKMAGSTYGHGSLTAFKNELVYQIIRSSQNAYEARPNSKDMSGTATVKSTASPPAVDPYYWGKSKNALVGSTSWSASGSNVFVCWNFPTFIQYGGLGPSMGVTSNARYVYFGYNVFYGFQSTNQQMLLYVGPTQGQTAGLLDMRPYGVQSIAHVDKYLFLVKNNTLMIASLAPQPDDPNATQAQVTAYVAKIKALLDDLSVKNWKTIDKLSGIFQAGYRWGSQHFVTHSLFTANSTTKTNIWKVEEKIAKAFTITAGRQVGSDANLGSTGYVDNTNGSYGLAGNAGTIQNTTGEGVRICCDWIQASGNNGYNGFSIEITGAHADIRAKYKGIKANGKWFYFDLNSTITAQVGLGNTIYSWWNTLADFVDGETYTIELIQA